MQKSTIMVRFLDLTLILLMAFLFKADLVVEHEVALPHGSQSGVDPGISPLTLTITESAWLLTSESRRVCDGRGITGLDACLQEHGSARQILITAESGVHVQRLVNVLDACARTSIVCAPVAS